MSSSPASKPKASLSEHLHSRFSDIFIGDGGKTFGSKSQLDRPEQPLLDLQKDIDAPDAYIRFSGVSRAELPVLDWNAHFRKAYTICFWIRPVLTKMKDGKTEEQGSTRAENAAPASVVVENRLLYRFATTPTNVSGTGVTVQVSDWVVLDEDRIQSTLTACSFDSAQSGGIEGDQTALIRTASSPLIVQLPLTLKLDAWQLVSCTHVFPYLKRPQWSCSVNGKLMGSGELPYPLIPTSGPACVMDCNTLLQNLTVGGAILPVEDNSTTSREAGGTEKVQIVESRSESTRAALSIDLASFALYPVAIPIGLQAVLADAGMPLSQQMNGAIVPILPPIANFNKGSSIEAGPKVGIPLVVHPQAMNIQKMASTMILGMAAVHARVLGSASSAENEPQQRIVCPLYSLIGETEKAPRVGLMQPGSPIRFTEETEPVVYLTGSIEHHHSLRIYCSENDLDTITPVTPNWTIAWHAQQLISFCVLPFFLALSPPGQIFGRQQALSSLSIRTLFALFRNDGQWAAQLIDLLAMCVDRGGARCQEELLQTGAIHVLASSLRLALLRASKAKFFSNPAADVAELERRLDKIEGTSVASANQSASSSSTPRHIPRSIVHACAKFVDVCCGPPAKFIQDLEPSQRVRRTSDMALTALFGFALDNDLWGGDPRAGAEILECVADRYGGYCLTLGYILRSQVSVQYFMDCVRLMKYDMASESQSSSLLKIGHELSRIMTAMLLASLSNRRSISQGEHDVASCVSALSDCPLGSLGAHVVLNSIVAIMVWCEIMPLEASEEMWRLGDYLMDDKGNQDQKMSVASRLGRNLLVSQFHDVVAPMILSRTVFSSESTSQQPPGKQPHSSSETGGTRLTWEGQWRLSLFIFSWVSSIAGADGLIAAKSCGSLMLASGLAGSLAGAMDGADKKIVSALYLPPPGMALMIGSTIRSEWSYTDLLSDRLQIMIPLLPGIVVCLLPSHVPSESGVQVSATSLTVLADVMTAVGGAFHRVFGGTIHHSDGPRSQVKNRRDGFSESVKAAKSFVPHLLVIAIYLDSQIERYATEHEKRPVPVYKPEVSRNKVKRIDLESWVDVSSTVNESVISEVSINAEGAALTSGSSSAAERVLTSCKASILNTVAGLISNAMGLGGAGTALALWNNVLSTLEESVLLSERKSKDDETIPIATPPVDDSAKPSHDCDESKTISIPSRTRDVLCRLVSIVLVKALKRHDQWEVWSYEMSSAVAKVCLLVEEKDLLEISSDPNKIMSEDQIVLLSALLDILSYGRDATGWCQLSLPAMSNSFSGLKSDKPTSDLSESSKLLLPVLHPVLRYVISSLKRISSETSIEVPGEQPVESEGQNQGDEHESRVVSLLDSTLSELDLSLTAAVVGLSFSAARDVTLYAMASLRRSIGDRELSGDLTGARSCGDLLKKLAEELRVRYDGERRLRENTLFDAYEDDGKDSTKVAAENSNAIERMILGGGILGNDSENEAEEISFGPKSPRRQGSVSDDFVLFHEPTSDAEKEAKGLRLGYAQYEGLGAVLEECKIVADTAENNEEAVRQILGKLSVYLDAWDALTKRDESESELVKIFTPGLTVSGSNGLDSPRDLQQLPILGSETAADAMSSFFEFAATERSRLVDVSRRFLPGHRHTRMSYAERFCWSSYIDLSRNGQMEPWERGVADGNRDIRSRILSVPCAPQFRRYIPKYLDHYSDMNDSESVLNQSDVLDSSDGHRRRSSVPVEFDAFTKTLLEAGNLEIVDITKKKEEEEEEGDVEEGTDLSPLRAPSGSVDELDPPIFNEGTLDGGNEDALSSENEDLKGDDGYKIEDEPPSDDLSSAHFEESGANLSNSITSKGQHSITTSAFSTPPDNASSSLSLMHSAAAGMIEQHVDNCLHVRAEGSRPCTMLMTSTHLVLEYEGEPEGFFEGEVLAAKEDADRQRMIREDGDYTQGPDEVFQQKLDRRQREIASLRPKSIRWNLSEVSHVYLRRYRLRDSSIELFFIPSGGTAFGGYGIFSPSSSLYLDFGPGREGNRRRDEAAFAIMQRAPPQAIKQWPDRSAQFLHDQLSRITIGWVEGRVTNFDYLLNLNVLAGRSYNDVCQYPVFPWVLAEYNASEIPDLTDKKNFRDLSKPVGALNPQRLEEFIERFNTFSDPSIPPFMYGSHYSTSAGVVLHFLVRLHPFAGLHRQLQSGNFDVADRLFSSVPRTWSMCTGTSAAEVKELTPEWYCNPSFLRNANNFKLGTSQDGDVIGDVFLPPWAKGSPERFVEVMRAALESEICSEMLPDWIDLIFGRKQQGPEAIKANNVFFYLTYYGSVDVASIEDPGLRTATELQIAHFGQCPMQLFRRPHVRRLPRSFWKLSFYQLMSAHALTMKPGAESNGAEDNSHNEVPASARFQGPVFGEPRFLPFFSAPLSHWVHLDAPPPGPHAPLVSVRFAGTDRCLAIDAKGIFHTFRWAWRPEERESDTPMPGPDFDKGCFVAQRELPRFRSVPRLMLSSSSNQIPVVAISKTLFAGRSVLLVLSDGDGRGGLGLQLVDPSKGQIRGEVLIPSIHSARITCIATDPIGTAAGHGGVGGELALIGSADGTASLWRFMSSHYLPLRPRVRFGGHGGRKISAATLCSSTNIAATISRDRCCLFSIGNGALLRSFGPPPDTLDFPESDSVQVDTKFADSAALALSVQGFVITVCESVIRSQSSNGERKIITLHLFSIEGVSLGSKPLESWRGLPHKLQCTPDGTAAMLCCGRGITIHRISACSPLEIIDEWQITESDSLGISAESIEAAFDVDFGPSLNRPVCAAAACSKGALRLHALPGISSWSERHKKSGLSQTVGTALAKPAQRINRAVRDGLGLGRQIAGMGRDIGREVSTDVKERGVGGFLGSIMSRKSSSDVGKSNKNE